MKMQILVLGSIASMTLGLMACGHDLSKEDAARALAAMSQAAQSGEMQAQNNALSSADTTFTIDQYTYNCPAGGSLDLSGTLTVDTNASSFAFAAGYNGCTVNGISIDGDLDYSGSLTGTLSSYNFEFSMSGSVSFSGDVDGDCDIDFSGSFNGSTYSYSGTVCGYQASSL